MGELVDRRVGAYDPAESTRRRREELATPGCVPGRTDLSDCGGGEDGPGGKRPRHRCFAGDHGFGGGAGDGGGMRSVRRPRGSSQQSRNGPPLQARRRSAGSIPGLLAISSAIRTVISAGDPVGAHDPAGTTRRRRTEPATPGCVPGAPICPTVAADEESPVRETSPAPLFRLHLVSAEVPGTRAEPCFVARSGLVRVSSSTGHASGRRTILCQAHAGSPPARRVPLRGARRSRRLWSAPRTGRSGA